MLNGPTIIPKIECPTLIMRGAVEKGSLTTDKDLEAALPLFLKPYRVESFLNCGHGLFKESAQPIAQSVVSFLNEG